MLNDVGRFVGRYFQALAWLSILSMVVRSIVLDSFQLDLSFLLLFWAAPYLIKHHPPARIWTIRVCGFFLVMFVAMFIYAAIAGTQHMTVTLFKRIEHPTLLQVASAICPLAILLGLPVVLLLTPQARREFQLGAGV